MFTPNDFRSPTVRLEADDAEIRRQIDKIIEGLRAKDLDALRQVYATDVVSFDIDPPLQHVGIAAKIQNWAAVFQFFQTVTYEVRDLTLTIGDDVAFGHAFGRLSGTQETGAEIGGMWVRVTYGLRKIDGVWLITHDQVSVPLDVHSGTGVVDLAPAART
ncbi:nuclear transport factor 2 family protein [Nocardia sp. NEAU-G5]|uniref:Nuclear transport factor 2 family protein n=1 Tax=Nocardia albiluteola TaxID=2842303 RepID=A0ABS6AXV3_9NOCA|nr:nuclear transport factor 2 family protein [Nocardia albiluteola]MBU3062341.1 nuclear transport factor 2 family protein [Nocardia albiluteola]